METRPLLALIFEFMTRILCPWRQHWTKRLWCYRWIWDVSECLAKRCTKRKDVAQFKADFTHDLPVDFTLHDFNDFTPILKCHYGVFPWAIDTLVLTTIQTKQNKTHTADGYSRIVMAALKWRHLANEYKVSKSVRKLNTDLCSA